jgi:hypothetical protein
MTSPPKSQRCGSELQSSGLTRPYESRALKRYQILDQVLLFLLRQIQLFESVLVIDHIEQSGESACRGKEPRLMRAKGPRKDAIICCAFSPLCPSKPIVWP